MPRPLRVRWAAVVLVAAVICYFSVFTTPDAGVTPTGPLGLVGMDKWAHAVGYGVLGAALAVALAGERGPAADGRATAALAVAGATGYGVAMEIAQLTAPLRHTSVGDVVADALGATAAVAVWWAFSRRVARRDEADLRS
ncbi:VanZ family protein [Haladaptatus salinisoli]|uniref:VanZ family protein n=1 Tax=Haladaptatus salinisoli TaxID=2884876 RepID=UPI001D0AE6D5|nr:VanZ family protein [Haladaptatus salinisoli]